MVSHYLCSVHSAFNSSVDVLTAVSRSRQRVAVDPDSGKKENTFAAFFCVFCLHRNSYIVVVVVVFRFYFDGVSVKSIFSSLFKEISKFFYSCVVSLVFSLFWFSN